MERRRWLRIGTECELSWFEGSRPAPRVPSLRVQTECITSSPFVGLWNDSFVSAFRFHSHPVASPVSFPLGYYFDCLQVHSVC